MCESVCERECDHLLSTGTWHSPLVLALLSTGRKYLMLLFWLLRGSAVGMELFPP